MGTTDSSSSAIKRIAAAVLAAVFVIGLGSIALADHAGSVDVTATGSSANVDGAIVFAVHDNTTVTGTGTFEPFVRVYESNADAGRQRGYNTDGTTEFGTGASHRVCLDPDTVPLVSIGGVLYWEFALDLNESDSDGQPPIDIIDLELYATDDNNITGYPFAGTAQLLWETDTTIHMEYPGTGQGRADYLFYIPAEELDPSITCLVLYSEFINGDASYEEWKRRPNEFDASKTAAGTYDETYTWELEKTGAAQDDTLFAGETGTIDWTVTATRTGPTESNHTVSGAVTVVGTGDSSGTVVGVSDHLDAVDISGDLVCPASTGVGPSLPYSCTYSVTHDSGDGGTNHVRFMVDTGAAIGGEPIYIVATASADYTYAASGVVTNGSGQLTDDQIGLGESIDDSATRTGSTDYVCSTDPADYTDGTATITGTNTANLETETQDLSDDASDDFTCYLPTVSKTASGAYDEVHEWTIDKTADAIYHLWAGDSQNHGYSVSVTETVTDRNHEVSGTVTVTNPHPDAAAAVSLSDELSDGTSVSFSNCAASFTVAAGTSTVCNYIVADGDGDATSNTATMTFNGVEQTDTAGFTYVATIEGHESINVTDDVGTVDTSDDRKTTFGTSGSDDYAVSYGCSTDPADYNDGTYWYEVTNEAAIDETGDSDTATVTVHCYLPSISVVQAGEYDQTHSWEITKSVNPVSQSGGPGENLGWTWTVMADKTVAEDNYVVSGAITVTNPHPSADADYTLGQIAGAVTSVASASDLSCDGDATADGDASTVISVPAAGSVDCTFVVSLSEAEFLAAAGSTSGFTPTVNVLGHPSVDAYDDLDGDGVSPAIDQQISNDATWTPTDSVVCSTDIGDYTANADGTYSYGATVPNTAYLYEVDTATEVDSDSASTTWSCHAAKLNVAKTTNGAVDATKDWTFDLYAGPDGHGGAVIESHSTVGDADGVMNFDTALRVGGTYTLCEAEVAAGWTTEWAVNGAPISAYNPNSDDVPPEDLGNRCYDFTVAASGEINFSVDNRQDRDGGQRTPGYWKNWSTCSNGNQVQTAANNGGPDEGFWLIDDVLAVTGGLQIGDILVDTCEEAVALLSHRDVDSGRIKASDPAYKLARSLIAAEANHVAGASTCTEVTDAIAEAHALLAEIGFDGTGSYLRGKSGRELGAIALELHSLLDAYNNGEIC